MPSILRTLIQTGVVHAIPLDVDMDISIDKLAAKTKFPNTSLLARFIHLCVMNHFFKEPREGYVAHNLHSKILAVEDVWNVSNVSWIKLYCGRYYIARERCMSCPHVSSARSNVESRLEDLPIVLTYS